MFQSKTTIAAVLIEYLMRNIPNTFEKSASGEQFAWKNIASP